MKKRITALLLCLVMVFSLIPTSVWATEAPTTDTGSGGIEEQDPNALTEEGAKKILQESKALVAVKCINPNGGCNVNPVKYGLAASTFTMEENEENGYTLTVETAPFVAAYSKSGQGRGLPHDLYSAETLTWKLSRENDVWTVKPAVEGVDDTILVTHIPEATYDVLKGMQGVIKTRCVNNTTAYTEYGVIAGVVGESAQITKGEVSGTYNLTVSTKNFADAASKHNDRDHDLLTGETAKFVLSLSKNDTTGKYVWTATPVTEPDGICEVAHRVKVTFDQNYTNAPAATEAMYKYDTAEVMEGAFPADPSRSGYVFQGWNTKADGTGDAFSNATAVTEDVTVYAQWGQLHPVQLVIYRNGDTSKAYKTVSLDPQLKGTVIDLNDVDIGKYYTGNYEFYGWYDDGLWNIYKTNVAAGEDAPAGLTTKTVNGWTNFKCMVYDYENVVYFQTKEAMEAYQADHSKTEGIVKSVKALHGSALPTVDAPEATRAGYTFQYWSREGQSVNVTGQTVNGWTNLYAAWTPNTDTPYKVEHYKQKLDGTYVKADTDELTGTTDTRATAVAKSYTGFTVDKTVEGTVESGIIAGDGSLVLKLYYTRNSYIISSDLRINGNTTVKETGKAYSWTHRYGGKFEETIDYTDMFAALKAKTLEVDAANEPYSVDIKLCFPGTQDPANATPYNETILTYGQTGGGWNPGVKNTAYIWGYATTSYQVIFKAEDGTEIETKIVEYGKTVASADPGEKYGYNFVGWVDQDGNAFTFDNDGNSVTEITRKTVLTAQWAKKVYTIGPDLRINGGEPVKAPGKNYSWSPRYSGEYQDVIDYDKVFEDLRAKVEEVDKDNEPSKIEIKLCFPGKTPATTDEGGLFNEVITYFGQEGASWNPGVKNTAYIWGYATTYYDVSFDSNGGTAVDTQKNVQYGTTATKPENPTREGYRFLGWFTKDGEAFDFSTPITKSMTLTAKWEIVNINAYIIPITSDGTQLVGAGFDMALNTTTLGRVGLPGYENEDAVRIHFATFASSAGLADADDYFPGTDPLVVKAVADLKKGLERRFAAGVNEAKAEGIMSKTNWTYLHVGELDDEEDTNFLSGNLVFYSARFVTEDSEHVTGMPNAEYTHNAVAVYDYYLDGETITIPDAVPERYGYDFLGWSVKAVPAENDKLLKAGDTVTVDGDVVFTAQWKLKEYTVSFDSKGGTKVDSQIVEHGSTATKPGNPHRNDYTFKGWYLDGKKFDFSTPITGDITLVARWATKTSGGSNSSSDTTTKDNGKTVQSGKTFDGGIALYVGLSVLSATGSALVITKKKRG